MEDSMYEALLHCGSTIILLAGLGFALSGTGRYILYRAGMVFSSRGEELFFSAGIGFGALGYAVFALGAVYLLLPQYLYPLLCLFALTALAGWTRPTGIAPAPSVPAPVAKEDRIAALPLAIVLLAGFLLALTPETGKDALAYHLAVPKLFLKHHGVIFIPGNIFANYPLHSEMLFLVGLFLQDDVLAKGMHFLALLGTLLGIWQLSRLHLRSNRFPAFSMLAFCTIPTVFVTSTMAYSDLFAAFFCLAAILAFLIWSERKEERWLILCALFTGFATATKYTVLLLPFLGCLGILWTARKRQDRPSEAVRHLVLYLFVFLVAGSPFYLRNWLVTGNPFYPYLYTLFGGRGWDPDQARMYDLFLRNLGMGRTPADYLLLPWNLSFRAEMDSPRFDGLLGPLFLLILPFALAMRGLEPPLKICMAYGAFTFLFWACSAQQLRYLIPLFPLLAVMTGSVLSAYHDAGRRRLFPLLVILAIAGIGYSGYHIGEYFLKIRPAGVITGAETREGFLKRQIPPFALFRYINDHVPPDAAILMIFMRNRGFLLEREYYSDSLFESYTLQKILARSRTAADVDRELRTRGFTHILYDSTYVTGGRSAWPEPEKNLFLSFQTEFLTFLKQEGSCRLYRLQKP